MAKQSAASRASGVLADAYSMVHASSHPPRVPTTKWFRGRYNGRSTEAVPAPKRVAVEKVTRLSEYE